jgi:hypothetical protein
MDGNVCDNSGYNKDGGGLGVAGNTATLDMSNCTLVGNTPSGLMVQSTNTLNVTNTIIYFNSSTDVAVNSGTVTYSHVCTTNSKSGTGNITSDPAFVDYSGEDYRLTSSSPCVDSGEYSSWMDTAVDYFGNPRLNGTVDMGACEYQ